MQDIFLNEARVTSVFARKYRTSKPNATVWKIISNFVTQNKHEKSDQIVCKEVQQIKVQCIVKQCSLYCSDPADKCGRVQ